MLSRQRPATRQTEAEVVNVTTRTAKSRECNRCGLNFEVEMEQNENVYFVKISNREIKQMQ